MSPALAGRFLIHCATREFLKQFKKKKRRSLLGALISVASPYSTNSVRSIHITISQGSSKYRKKHVKKVQRAGCRSKSGYHLTLQTVLKGGQNEIS